MIVALSALLDSIVDLLIFPKIVMKNIANMHRKHDVCAFSKTLPKHRIVKNIGSLRNVKIAHPYLEFNPITDVAHTQWAVSAKYNLFFEHLHPMLKISCRQKHVPPDQLVL